jgi:tetratricopeptide (TPR) repeat protein
MRELFALVVVVVSFAGAGSGVAGPEEKFNEGKVMFGRWEKCLGAAKLFREVVADETTPPDMKAQSCHLIGQCLYKAGQVEAAIPELRAALEKYPQPQSPAALQSTAESQLCLGQAYLRLKQYDQALAELKKVADAYPKAGLQTLRTAETTLADCYCGMKKYDEAIAILKASVAKGGIPSSQVVDAYDRIGNCHIQLGQPADAAQAYTASMRVGPVSTASRDGLLKAV